MLTGKSILEERNENGDFLGLTDFGFLQSLCGTQNFQSRFAEDLMGYQCSSEDYRSITRSDIFPLSLCHHRWIEDKKGFTHST